MYFKLPHDVVCACAKRDEPSSRRSRFHFSIQNSLYTNKTYRSLSAGARQSVENLYYYRSFSCLSKKIISKALSFRMMLFPPREAMTTAEPPEPFPFQHSEFIIYK
jgi:hypothetical protein